MPCFSDPDFNAGKVAQVPYYVRIQVAERLGDTIHVIASLRHYVHQIASPNEDTLEFVSSLGDCVTVELTDDERRGLRSNGPCPQ
jgi:hypothetical protein